MQGPDWQQLKPFTQVPLLYYDWRTKKRSVRHCVILKETQKSFRVALLVDILRGISATNTEITYVRKEDVKIAGVITDQELTLEECLLCDDTKIRTLALKYHREKASDDQI